MGLIKFGELSLLFLLPVINSILNFGNFELYKKTEYENHPIVNCLISNLLLCALFIPLLITKFCVNSKSENKNYHKSSLIFQIKNEKIFIIFVGFLYELVNILHSIFGNKIGSKKDFFMNDYLFELFFIVVASKIFTKALIYKHHQVSIIFIFLLGVIFYLIDYKYYEYKYVIIFVILKQIIFGVCIIFIKYITESKYYSIFKMLFTFGVVGLILDLFILIITSNAKCSGQLDDICSAKVHNYKDINVLENYSISYFNLTNITDITNITDNDIINIKTNLTAKNIANYKLLDNDIIEINYIKEIDEPDYYLDNLKNFFDNLKDKESKDTVFNLFNIIFSFISIFLFIIIVQKLFPSYTYFTNILVTIFSKIKELFKNEKDINAFIILLQIIIILLIFFWALVYNEIIELNFCELNDDTKKNKLKSNDYGERRKKDWAMNKVSTDADVTLVDENYTVDYSRSGDNYGSKGSDYLK